MLLNFVGDKNQHVFLSSHKNRSIRWVDVCIVWNLQHENRRENKVQARKRKSEMICRNLHPAFSFCRFKDTWTSSTRRTTLNVCGRQTDSETLESKQHKFRVFKISALGQNRNRSKFSESKLNRKEPNTKRSRTSDGFSGSCFNRKVHLQMWLVWMFGEKMFKKLNLLNISVSEF